MISLERRRRERSIFRNYLEMLLDNEQFGWNFKINSSILGIDLSLFQIALLLIILVILSLFNRLILKMVKII